MVRDSTLKTPSIPAPTTAPYDVVTYNGSTYFANTAVPAASGTPNPVPPQSTSWTLVTQGFNFTGPFNTGASYNAYDVATYNGSAYFANAAIPASSVTPDQGGSWQLLSQAGAAGATGAAGRNRSSGCNRSSRHPTGPTGPQGRPAQPAHQGSTGATGGQGPDPRSARIPGAARIPGIPRPAGAAGAAGSTGARGPAGLAVGYSNLNQSFPDSPISTSNPSPSIIAKTATAPAGTYYLYAMTSILLNGGFGNEGIVPVVVCRFMTGSNTVQPANVANFQGAVGSGSTVSLVDVVTITSPDTFEYVCGAQATTSASSTQGAITALLINSSN